MLRVLRRPDQLQHLSVLGRSLTCSPVALGEHARCEKTDVPAGHQNSDLRKQVCHIGLNRRRDLSLREDLCLFQPGGKATVRDIFKVGSSHSLGSKRLCMCCHSAITISGAAGQDGWCLWCSRYGTSLLKQARTKLPEQCKSDAVDSQMLYAALAD